MKTYIMTLLTAATFVAGIALAEEGQNHKWAGRKSQMREQKRDPAACEQATPIADQTSWRAERSGRQGGPMSPEMSEQMRAEHRAIRELGRAAREETDPAKKEELVAQLRSKILEVGDRMQKHREERLSAAEGQLTRLQEQVRTAKRNRERRADEQVQRILSGERPTPSGASREHPKAKRGHRHSSATE